MASSTISPPMWCRKLNKLRGHEHGEAKVVETLQGRDLLGLALHWPVRRAARLAARPTPSIVSSRGTTSAPPRAPASSTSRRAVVAKTSRSRRARESRCARAGGRERRLRRGLRLADGQIRRRGGAANLRQSTREGLFLPDRVVPACLSALLALRHRTDLPPGGRVVHLDA